LAETYPPARQSVARAIIVMAVEDLTSEAGSLKNAGSVAR
jgi:hypothetical protein